MPVSGLQVVRVNTNEQALEGIRKGIGRLQAADPLAAIWVLLPPALEAVWRRRPATRLNVHSFDFGRLTTRLTGQAGSAARLLQPEDQALLVATIAEEAHAEGLQSEIRESLLLPGFQRRLLVWFKEMQHQAIAPGVFRGWAEAGSGTRNRDLALLYDRYVEWQEQTGIRDPAVALAHVCSLLRDDAADLDLGTGLLVAGFVDFTPLQRHCLKSLQRRGIPVEVFLPAGHSEWGRARSDASAEELGDPHGSAPGLGSGECKAAEVAEWPTAEDEVRWVLRRVKQMLQSGRAALEDITLCVPSLHDWNSLLRRVAAEYRVPLNLSLSLAEHPLCLAFRQALLAAPEFTLAETWDLLLSPWLHHPDMEADCLEQLRILMQAFGVIRDREQWLSPFHAEADWDRHLLRDMGLREEPADLRRDLECAAQLLLDGLTPPNTQDEHRLLDWVQGLLQPEGVGVGIPPEIEPAERALAEAVRLELEQVVAAARRPLPVDRHVRWPDLRHRLLEQIGQRSIPLYEPEESVSVLEFNHGWMVPTRHLFVLGLNEGSLPATPSADPIFSVRERDNHALALRAHDHRAAWLQWDMLVTGCADRLYLSRSRRSITGGALESGLVPASPFWSGGEDVQTEDKRPASRRELLRHTVREGTAHGALAIEAGTAAALERIADLARVDALRAGIAAPTGYEGVLSSPTVRRRLRTRFGMDHRWSPSALENFPACPMGFFAERVLGLKPDATPEEGMPPAVEGNIYHDALERIYGRLRGRRLTQLSGRQADDLVSEVLAEGEGARHVRLKYQPYPLESHDRERIRRNLIRLVRADLENADHLAADAWMPMYHEKWMEWIEGSDLLRETGSVRLGGIVDRIDVDDEGNLRVIDYKRSGRTRLDMERGKTLQAVLYGRAVHGCLGPVAYSAYWNVRNPEAQGPGGGARRSSPEIATPHNDGDPLVKAVLEQLDHIVADVTGGRFPSAPRQLDRATSACASWCGKAEFCQPSWRSRNKGRRRLKSA